MSGLRTRPTKLRNPFPTIPGVRTVELLVKPLASFMATQAWTMPPAKRLRHTLRYADESTPTRRARPRGTIGAEVWVRVSPPGDPPPSDPSDLKFLLLSTRTPAAIEFTGPDGGKTAHYMVRWLSTRGEAGPWSETASATIGK